MATSGSTKAPQSKSKMAMKVRSSSMDWDEMKKQQTIEKKARRHSVTGSAEKDKEQDGNSDGSLRKVTKWFKGIKEKMNKESSSKIKIDPRRQSRLTRFGRVVEEEEEEEDQNSSSTFNKTATWENMSYRSKEKSVLRLDKRFNSMDSLPRHLASHQELKKTNSFSSDGYSYSSQSSICETPDDPMFKTKETTQERILHLTEMIEDEINIKDCLLNEIFQQITTSSQIKDSSIKIASRSNDCDILKCCLEVNNLTRIINKIIQPENLFIRDHKMISSTEDGDEEEVEEILLMIPSDEMISIINHLHQQLTSLMITLEINAEETNGLKDNIEKTYEKINSNKDLDMTSLLQASVELENSISIEDTTSLSSDSDVFIPSSSSSSPTTKTKTTTKDLL